MGKLLVILVEISLIFVLIYVYLFSPLFVIQPKASQNNKKIGFDQSFEINFSSSIDETYYKKITLEPNTDIKVLINEAKTKITISPYSIWEENTQYKLNLPKARAVNFKQIKESSFYFVVASYPNVISTNPKNNDDEININPENPIKINFDKSIENFDVNFSLNPKTEINYSLNESNKTNFTIFPKDKLENGMKYNLFVSLKPKNLSEDQYKKIYNLEFTTSLPIPAKPKTWRDQLTERLEEARQNSKPLISLGKYIDIDIQNQILIMFENGKNLGTFLISSGRPDLATPKGTWQILNKNPRKWSRQYKLYMPYWMAITNQGHGIHELPEYPNGYKEGTNSLGQAVSHGCIRLGVDDAKKVYNWAEIGTKVVVH